MPRRVDDPLHALLCHTIRLCWKSLRGQQVLKKVEVDQDKAAWPRELFPNDDFSPRDRSRARGLAAAAPTVYVKSSPAQS